MKNVRVKYEKVIFKVLMTIPIFGTTKSSLDFEYGESIGSYLAHFTP